jgi:pimeloyl-ACP methyl ester carboxylesterase
MIEVEYSTVSVLGKDLWVKHIHHKVQVSAKRPILVFLHEALGCIELWRDFPDALAQETGLDALVYDRQGHGKSSSLATQRRPDYVHVEALDYLPRLLNLLDLNQVILVGHSEGGSIALLFASRYPQRACCLITEAAHVFVEESALAGIEHSKQAYETTELHDKLAKYHGDKTDQLFAAWAETWLSEDFRRWNIEAELPRVTCPVLAIHGKLDEYGTVAHVERIVQNTSGKAIPLVVSDCGHVPHRQARETVLDSMVSFIRQLCVHPPALAPQVQA